MQLVQCHVLVCVKSKDGTTVELNVRSAAALSYVLWGRKESPSNLN